MALLLLIGLAGCAENTPLPATATGPATVTPAPSPAATLVQEVPTHTPAPQTTATATLTPIATRQKAAFAIEDLNTTWSPGSRLAYSQEAPEGWELVLLDFGQDPPLHTVLAQASEQIEHLAWSPDGRQIVYLVYDFSVNADFLWVVDPDTPGSQRQIAPDPYTIYGGLEWAPTSDSLVFSGAKGGVELDSMGMPETFVPPSLWQVDVKRGRVTQLTPEEITYANSPAWSPDGKWIAFEQDEQIWLLAAAGKELRRLTQNWCWDNLSPAWTADSSQVLFFRTQPYGGAEPGASGGPPGVWAIDLQGQERPVAGLDESFSVGLGSLEISPDGAWIALVFRAPDPSKFGEGNEDVYVLSTASGELFKVSQQQAPSWFNGWTPDGHTLLYTVNSSQGFRLFLAGTDSDPARPLFPQGGNRDAVWEPHLNATGEPATPVAIKLPGLPTSTAAPTLTTTATIPAGPVPVLAVQKPGLDELRAYFESLPPPAGWENFFFPATIYPEEEYVTEDVSGDGQPDRVGYDFFGGIISAIIYQDVSGDGWEDLIVYDVLDPHTMNGWIFILPWDGTKYADPFILKGEDSMRSGGKSSFWFEDMTGDGKVEVIYNAQQASGGSDDWYTDTYRMIIHCAGTNCREVWNGLVASSKDSSITGGLELQTVKLKLIPGQQPSIRTIRSGFSIFCCLFSFEPGEPGPLIIFPTTATYYTWNGEIFEQTSEQELRPGQEIASQARLDAAGKGNRRATISWQKGEGFWPYLETCQLSINGNKVGDPFYCRHQFAQVNWQDVNGDGEQEVVVIAYGYTYPTFPHQRLLIYGWDKKDARLLADVQGRVIQADLFGVRLTDTNGDGVMEILAAVDSGDLPVEEYRWNGERYELIGVSR